MKRIVICLSLFIMAFISFSVSLTTDIAYAEGEIKEEIEKEIEDNLNSLIDEDLNAYFSNLESNFGVNLKDFIKGIISGNITISAENVLEGFVQAVKSGIKSSLLSLISIVVLAILSSLSKSLTAGFKKEGIETIIHYAIYGAIICTLAIMVGDVVKEVSGTLNSINELVDRLFPVILTLLTAIGGVGGASFLQPITLLVSNLVIKLIINIIIPIFYATIVFTFVGNLSDTIKLEKCNKSLKSIASWTLGIVFSLVTSFVAMQGLVGASIDTITIKSTKFALSSYIPILGGYLAEGFDIVMASCVLIKNALGLSSFLILIGILITPIVKILLFSLSLKLISAFIEPIGENKVASLLYDTSSGLNILLASLGGVAFIIFIILSLIIGAYNGGIV